MDKLCLKSLTKLLLSTSRYLPNSLIQQRVPNCAMCFIEITPSIVNQDYRHDGGGVDMMLT